jgi:hypothetical protein
MTSRSPSRRRRPVGARALALVTREAYRRELVPERLLWWLASAGMRDWYRVLSRRLAAPLAAAGTPDARALLARAAARTFERRREAPGVAGCGVSRGRDLALLMGALYRIGHDRKAAWIFAAVGGPARSAGESLRARMLLSRMPVRGRWEEVATHLGELLIVLTEDLPAHLPHARKVLGDVCFDAGARYAARIKAAFGIPDTPPDPPRAAMEILRMSEYVFRVNPEHWSASDGGSGWLEGTACLWWREPGWSGAHCGIFGQFQSGIASAFGLRYHLSKTIPKHGGHTCRIDVKPITLRKKSDRAEDTAR